MIYNIARLALPESARLALPGSLPCFAGDLAFCIAQYVKQICSDILLRNDTMQCWIEGPLISRRAPVFKTIWYDAHPQKETETDREREGERSPRV